MARCSSSAAYTDWGGGHLDCIVSNSTDYSQDQETHARGQGKRSHFPRGSEDIPSVRGYGFSSNVEDRQLYAGGRDVPGDTQISVETSERWLLGHARDR